MSIQNDIFNSSKKIGDKGIPIAIELMNKYFDSDFKVQKLAEDIKGSDISDGCYNIDVKYNDYNDKNFVAEWRCGIRDSWLVDPDKITHFILWIDTEAIHLMDYPRMHKFFTKNMADIKAKYPERVHHINVYPTYYSLVPMKQMRNAIITTWKRIK